jgi:cyclohexanone monooxygenase
MINEQSKHLAYVLRQALDRQATRVEATAEAEAKWVETIMSLAVMRQKFQEECTPGYYNNEGQPSALAARNGSYGAGPMAFIKVLEDWRSEGELAGLALARD